VCPGAVDVGEFADGRIKFVGVYLEKVPVWPGVVCLNCQEFLKGERPLIAAIVRDDRLIIPKGNNHLRPGTWSTLSAKRRTCSSHLSIFDKHATRSSGY
jgi:trk system potassium uptake protein TrkA